MTMDPHEIDLGWAIFSARQSGDKEEAAELAVELRQYRAAKREREQRREPPSLGIELHAGNSW
jgi:hypothetical protein